MRRRSWLAAAGGWLGAAGATRAQSAERGEDDGWPALRRSLFGTREIVDGAEGLIELQAPVRAEDAAVVPLAVRALIAQTPQRFIRKLHVVIDHNPSPMGAVFAVTPASGRADIETRVRVEQYSPVRAIAEMNDGRLVMARRFVKASGGCSAPAGKDLAEAMANLGRMRLKIEEPAAGETVALAQLMVSHPNLSGLAIDQLTRLAPLPRYVRQVEVTLDGAPLMQADVDFTLSENPNPRFRVDLARGRQLKAVVTDTDSARFERAMTLPAA